MTIVDPVIPASDFAVIGVGGANGTDNMFKPLDKVRLNVFPKNSLTALETGFAIKPCVRPSADL